jgi:hypothetical protein
MPIRKKKQEIVEFWTKKSTNPNVVKERFEDVSDLHKRRIIAVVELMMPINDLTRRILDDHGIAGGQRMDYYSYARKLWKALYMHGLPLYDRFTDALKTYYIATLGLREDILDEITREVRAFINEVKAKEETEEKIKEEAEGSIIAGDEVSGQDVG